MENEITSLIFDFDGVIADTDTARLEILNALFEKRGVNLEIRIEMLTGLSTKSFLKQNFPDLSESDINEIIKERHKIYFANLEKYCIPFINMQNTLIHLYNFYDLYIVTTNELGNLEKQLSFLKISHLFKKKIGRELSEDKTLTKTYKNISNRINKSVNECIVIEDSKIGVSSAKNEGYFCIKFNPYEKSFNSNEDIELRNYDELKSFLRNTTR